MGVLAMVNRLAGLVVLGACGWGAVVLFLCAVQLAGETVAWMANGGLGRLPGWSWPLIAAGVLGLVGVAWFRWLWPGEVSEEVERRGEEPGAAVGGIGRPVCQSCFGDASGAVNGRCPGCYGPVAGRPEASVGRGGVVGTPPGVGWGTGPHGVQGGGQVVILPPGYKIVPATAAEEQRDNTVRACDDAAMRDLVAKERAEGKCADGCPFCQIGGPPAVQEARPFVYKAKAEGRCGPAAMAEFLDGVTKEREGRGGA